MKYPFRRHLKMPLMKKMIITILIAKGRIQTNGQWARLKTKMNPGFPAAEGAKRLAAIINRFCAQSVE